MKKIESLTPEQEKLLPVYRDKWLAIGLSTEKADHAQAEDALRRAYQVAGHEPPKQIIWAGSPLSAAITIEILKNETVMKRVFEDLKKTLPKKAELKRTPAGASVRASVRDSVGASVRASVKASVGASVGDSVWASVWASVRDSVGDSVWASVWDSVWASVRASVSDSVWASVRDSVSDSVRASVRDSVSASVKASVGDSVRASVWDSVRASVGDSVGDSVRSNYWSHAAFGQQDAHWLGFYDYFREVLSIKDCEKLLPLMDLARHSNWFYPYKNIAVMSEKPVKCELKGTRIHCDGGPAIQYPDGFSVWALNGVRVSQEIAETPAQALGSQLLLKERNAEVRRELVRKIGIERVVRDLKAKCVDKRGDYELLFLDLGDGRKRPYLKMLNPSIHTYHIEGVHPDCLTVSKALAWRNGIEVAPAILT